MYEKLEKPMKLALASIAIACASAAHADPITGEELPGSDSFNAATTNAASHTNGTRPYVLFAGRTSGSVDLHFYNPTNFSAYFEYRSDADELTSGTNHYFITGDYVYPFFSLAKNSDVVKTFTADAFVEIRSAFGPENDWYFDWTAFKVPVPGVPALLALGLLGLGYAQRRRSAE